METNSQAGTRTYPFFVLFPLCKDAEHESEEEPMAVETNGGEHESEEEPMATQANSQAGTHGCVLYS